MKREPGITPGFFYIHKMIQPCQSPAALVRDITSAVKRHQENSFDLWWLGQSGFLLAWKGKTVLFDPYLSDSLTKKYALTNKPHVRMSERVIAPEQLTGIDIITSSHQHTDHLDAETLTPVFQNNGAIDFIIPEAIRELASQRAGCIPQLPIGMNEGDVAEVKGFHFHAIASAHNELDKDAHGNSLYLGYVVRFGNFCIYHSGDTLWYPGLENKVRAFKPDVVLLPINGHVESRGVAGNMDAEEAANFGKAVDALVIPHHYHMFEFNTADPTTFAQACDRIGQRYHILELGERFTLSK